MLRMNKKWSDVLITHAEIHGPAGMSFGVRQFLVNRVKSSQT